MECESRKSGWGNAGGNSRASYTEFHLQGRPAYLSLDPHFRRGEAVRAAFDVLRAAERPLTSREITERMLKANGVADPTQKQLRDLIGGVQSSLCNHKGRTVRAVGEGIPVRWALVK